MDFMSLYTSRDGRISRKTWWIGALILGVANIVISLLLLPMIGFGGPNMALLMSGEMDAAAVSTAITGAMQTSAWASLVLFLVFAYPAYCLSLKRRQDKNNNGLDLLVYMGLTIVMLLLQALGLAYTMTEVQGFNMPMPNTLFMVLGFVMAVYGIYLLVVLGFLKGTAGANTYGADPLGA